MSRRHTDRKATRTAQIAVLIAGAGAAAMLVGPVSRLLAPEVPVPKGRSVPDGANVIAATSQREIPTSDAIQALSLANPRTARPVVEKTPEPENLVQIEPDDTAEQEVVLDEPDVSGEWYYIGSIVSAKNSYAWFMVDGVQFLLARGNSKDGRRLVEVHADHVIIVDSSNIERRIDLLPPSRAWPEPGMRASSNPDPNSPAARAMAASSARPTAQGSPVRARGPRAADVYREQINRSRAASLPPVRPAPGTQTAASDSRSRDGRFDPGDFPPNLDPVEFSEFISKVSTGDYDPHWAREIMDRAGLEIDSPINEQIDRLAQLGVTVESNPSFFQNLDELQERVIDAEADPGTQEKLKAILAEQRAAQQEQQENTGQELDEETRRKLEEIREKERSGQ
ncbi:MAG: hypothetical protein KF768_10400 [Phycisphaeraceae bacterium]|nr:hypothetical protein [Phycisphaeraceae bacterium]